MKITFLGTGTSCGVPMPTCTCEVCTSQDPRDSRLRASILVETNDNKNILIDCGPDFRQQALKNNIGRLDALFITHNHFDHCAGLDDLRAYAFRNPLDAYADETVTRTLNNHYDYIFIHRYPGVPQVNLNTISPEDTVTVGETKIIPIRVFHGKLPILAFRIGKLAYITDCTCIPDTEWSKLEGIDTLIIDALRWKSHPTHWSVDEAMLAVNRIKPRHTYFTHMSHDIGLHEEVNKMLAPNVELAFDGMTVTVQ